MVVANIPVLESIENDAFFLGMASSGEFPLFLCHAPGAYGVKCVNNDLADPRQCAWCQ